MGNVNIWPGVTTGDCCLHITTLWPLAYSTETRAKRLISDTPSEYNTGVKGEARDVLHTRAQSQSHII